jgi:hypothetical protein
MLRYSKEWTHTYTGVGRCESSNEAIGEATGFCIIKVQEAAQAVGLAVKEGSISVNLKNHTWDNDKNPITGERKCKASITFDCFADLE